MTQKQKAKKTKKNIDPVIQSEPVESVIVADESLDVSAKIPVKTNKSRLMPHNLIDELDSIISRLEALEKKIL
ncbi:hypothetical protein UFOVP410_78 [uncultured Caudovirales phage]|uniref:Uncharacterized protein n=1 Tax=uncultured Caudovirales phage TaxID=2100421 RepID=A0A6J5MBY8_9CAUD|nr:hypothetical protein UFOVP410_78 [uncultured Caudovirales phage]